MDVHLPFPRWSPNIQYLVTNLPKDGQVTHFPKDGHQPSPGWLTTIPRMGTGHPPSKGVVAHHPHDGHPPTIKLTTIHGIVITFTIISRMVNYVDLEFDSSAAKLVNLAQLVSPSVAFPAKLVFKAF